MSFRAKKELDEARKSGIVAPEIDSKTSAPLNPHIPGAPGSSSGGRAA